MQISYFVYRLCSIGFGQIRYVLPKKLWDNVRIIEIEEPLVEVIETDRIKIGLIKKEYDVVPKVRRSVAEKLDQVSKNLPDNINLVVIEGFRSVKNQQYSWDSKVQKIKQENPTWSDGYINDQVRLVVAQPNPLANHNCGGAVDVALAYHDGTLMDMGIEYPSYAMSADTYGKFKMFSNKITKKQKENRKILRDAMMQAGFVYYPGEWWHYCYGDRMWAVYSNKKDCFYGPVNL